MDADRAAYLDRVAAHAWELAMSRWLNAGRALPADEGTDGSGIMAQTPKHQTGAKVSAIPRQARGDV